MTEGLELKFAATHRQPHFRPDLRLVLHVWDTGAPLNVDYHYGVTALCGAGRGLYTVGHKWPDAPGLLNGRTTRICPDCRREAVALAQAGKLAPPLPSVSQARHLPPWK